MAYRYGPAVGTPNAFDDAVRQHPELIEPWEVEHETRRMAGYYGPDGVDSGPWWSDDKPRRKRKAKRSGPKAKASGKSRRLNRVAGTRQ